MVEVIIIISLSLIFIILLRRVPEVKIEGIDEKEYRELEPSKIIKEVNREFDDRRRQVLALLSRAERSFVERDFPAAEKIYLQIATLDPDNSKIYGRLGIIYLEQKDYADAASAFIEAIKRDPKNSFLYNNLGLVSYYLKDFKKSIRAFQKAIELDESPVKYINLAKSYEEIRYYQKAIEAVEAALRLEPDNPEYKKFLADLRTKSAV